MSTEYHGTRYHPLFYKESYCNNKHSKIHRCDDNQRLAVPPTNNEQDEMADIYI